MHFKNGFKVYLKYTSLVNSWWNWWVKDLNHFLHFFPIVFRKLQTLKSKHAQKYSWCIFHIHCTEVYLKHISNSAGQNTSTSLHNLWSNGLVVRVQVYQTKDPRLKTTRWLKNCLSLSSFKGQSNEYQRFLGNWWLKVSRHPPLWLCSLQTNELYS